MLCAASWGFVLGARATSVLGGCGLCLLLSCDFIWRQYEQQHNVCGEGGAGPLD